MTERSPNIRSMTEAEYARLSLDFLEMCHGLRIGQIRKLLKSVDIMLDSVHWDATGAAHADLVAGYNEAFSEDGTPPVKQ